MKTNAVRLLDEAKIPYELRQYEVDPEDAAVAKKHRNAGGTGFQNVSSA